MFAREPDKVQVVLSDLIMPGKTGWETVAEIRRLRPDVKVIYLSGYEADALAHKGNPDPHAPLLLKPVRPIELLTMLRRVIDS
jgi:YesN/AraC family two-component response regulator